jgi:hypothetical protein
MKGDVNSRVGEYTESTWWELVMKGGQGGGIRTLGEYEQLAALTAGVNVPTPAEADSLDFELASRIKRLLDGLSAGEHAVLMQLPGIHPGGFGSTRTAIDDLLQWEEISKKRRLATVALDADRIVLFRASLLSRLTQSRGKGLASWFPDGEATPSHGEFLGSVVRVPKWFFVEGTVHADPEGLGRDMATALIRGEDGVVLEALRRTAEGDGKGSKLDVPAVEDWIRRRITSEGDWAIVTNSWRAFELLVPRWWLQGRTNGDDHESSFGCPCRRISRSGPEFVVLVDRGNAVLTHRGQLAARDDAFLDAGMQLLIGVRELFESEIDQLAQSDPPVNEIDAKAQVRVEVVEIFDVTSSEHPRVFWGEVATP